MLSREKMKPRVLYPHNSKSSIVKKDKMIKAVPSEEFKRLSCTSIYEQKLAQNNPTRAYNDWVSATKKKYKQAEGQWKRELEKSRMREAQLEKQLSELKDQGEEKDRHNKNVTKTLEELRLREHQYERKIQELRQHVDQKDQALVDVSITLKDTISREKKLERGLNKLRIANQRKEQLNSTANKDLEESRKRELQLENNLEKLKEETSMRELQKEKELIEVRRERDEKDQLYSTACKALNDAQKREEKREGKIIDLKKQIKHKNKLINDLHAKEQALEGRLTQLKNQAKEKDVLLADAVKQAFNAQNANILLRDNVTNCKDEINLLLQQKVEHECARANVEKICDSVIKEKNQLDNEYKELQKKVNAEREKTMDEHERLTSRIARQARELKLAKYEIKVLKQTKADLKFRLIYNVNAAYEMGEKDEKKKRRSSRKKRKMTSVAIEEERENQFIN